MNFYSIAQIKAIETHAIASGLSELMLMKRAGFRSFMRAQQWFPDVKRVYVLCGGGNNGGDGLIFAQLAFLAGWQVEVGLTVSPADMKAGAASSVLTELAALGVLPKPFDVRICAQSDLVVDALLGIGLNGHVSPELCAIISAVNALTKPVLSLDIPSGLNADTGTALGEVVQATRTVTFLAHKIGLVSLDGPDYAGQVQVESLGISDRILDQVKAISRTVTLGDDAQLVRNKNSHKGMFGQALLLGGDDGMMGAVMLAAQSCARAGAGIVRVVTRRRNAPFLTLKCPEVMAYGDSNVADLVARSSVIAIGPGLRLNDWSKALWQQVLFSHKPMVVDAGALRILAANPLKSNDWILTPHPGEAAELLGVSIEEVQQDRLAAVIAIQEKFGGVVVLKGNGTLVYDGEDAQISDVGNGAMSTAGMGDVLTGLIAAFLAQGLSLKDAAIRGVMMHAEMGEQLAETQPVVLASDVVDRMAA